MILVVLVLFGLGLFGGPHSTPSETSTATSSTSYSSAASMVLASAVADAPQGYAQGSTKQLNAKEFGLTSSGYSLYSNSAGTLANMTILVFNSTSAAQTYVTSVISNDKALPGYADATSTLTAYRHYGTCYGFAESDSEGGQYVADGVCTKGNVYIQVHLASTSSLPSAEGDMSDFVGAAYRALG